MVEKLVQNVVRFFRGNGHGAIKRLGNQGKFGGLEGKAVAIIALLGIFAGGDMVQSAFVHGFDVSSDGGGAEGGGRLPRKDFLPCCLHILYESFGGFGILPIGIL